MVSQPPESEPMFVHMTAGQGSEEEWELLASGATGTPLHSTGQRNSGGQQIQGVGNRLDLLIELSAKSHCIDTER